MKNSIKNEQVTNALTKTIKMWLPSQAQKMITIEDYERFISISETQNLFFFLRKEDIEDESKIKVSADAIFKEIDDFLNVQIYQNEAIKENPTKIFQYDFLTKTYTFRVYIYKYNKGSSDDIVRIETKNPLELFERVKNDVDFWMKNYLERIELQLSTNDMIEKAKID